jgi:hypothetical protein
MSALAGGFWQGFGRMDEPLSLATCGIEPREETVGVVMITVISWQGNSAQLRTCHGVLAYNSDSGSSMI